MNAKRAILLICLFLPLPFTYMGWVYNQDRQLAPLAGEDGEHTKKIADHNQEVMEEIERIRQRKLANQN